MLRHSLSIGLFIALAGCGRANDSSSLSSGRVAPIKVAAPTEVERVARDFKRLTLMTEQPVLVNPEIAMLCRGAMQSDVDAARRNQGPHAHTTINIYMNASAAGAFRHSTMQNSMGSITFPYPVGSIIVKEKRGESYMTEGVPSQWSQTHDGIGGMIKRAPGYDSKHGDWEYFYFEEPSKIESGRIASCIQCHAGAAQRDYVFGDWDSRR